MSDTPLFFRVERQHRAHATLARNLAATAQSPAARQDLLDEAASHARAIPGSLYERMLIQR